VKESEWFFTEIDKFVLKPPIQDNFDSFDKIIKDFTVFLFEFNSQISGAILSLKRKNKNDIYFDMGNSQTSNPQRYP